MVAPKESKQKILSRKNLVIGGITIIVVAGIIYWLGWKTVFNAFRLVGFLGVFWIFIAYSTVMSSRALRWKLLLGEQGKTISFKYFLKVSFVAWGQNTFLPARLGELSRLYYLKQDKDVSVGKNTAAILAEKVLDVMTLSFVLGSSAVLVSVYQPISREIKLAFLIIGVLSFVGIIVLVLFSFYGQYFSSIFKKTPKLQRLYMSFQVNFASGFRTLLLSPKVLVAGTLLSALGWVLEGITIYIIAVLLGVSIPITSILLAAMFGYATFVFPLLPGSVGSFEAVVGIILIGFGVDSNLAFLIPFVTHVIVVLFLLVMGGISFILLGGINFEKEKWILTEGNGKEEEEQIHA